MCLVDMCRDILTKYKWPTQSNVESLSSGGNDGQSPRVVCLVLVGSKRFESPSGRNSLEVPEDERLVGLSGPCRTLEETGEQTDRGA